MRAEPGSGLLTPAAAQAWYSTESLDDKSSRIASPAVTHHRIALVRLIHLDRDGCADPHPLRRDTPDQELCHRSRATIPAPRVRSIRSVR